MAEENDDAASDAAEATNVWALGGDRNPYLQNIFVLLGIDPDELGGDFDRKARRLMNMIEAGQEVVRLGRTVSIEEVSRAVRLAASESEFLAERMLAHTRHKVDVKVFEAAIAAIDNVAFADPAGCFPVPLRNLSFLAPVLAKPTAVSGRGSSALAAGQLDDIVRPLADDERIFDL